MTFWEIFDGGKKIQYLIIIITHFRNHFDISVSIFKICSIADSLCSFIFQSELLPRWFNSICSLILVFVIVLYWWSSTPTNPTNETKQIENKLAIAIFLDFISSVEIISCKSSVVKAGVSVVVSDIELVSSDVNFDDSYEDEVVCVISSVRLWKRWHY